MGPFSTSFLVKYDLENEHLGDVKNHEDSWNDDHEAIGRGNFGHVYHSPTR